MRVRLIERALGSVLVLRLFGLSYCRTKGQVIRDRAFGVGMRRPVCLRIASATD
ncbi:MAG: hypothetical protein R3F56_26390 [Planctomycetota bacterium]